MPPFFLNLGSVKGMTESGRETSSKKGWASAAVAVSRSSGTYVHRPVMSEMPAGETSGRMASHGSGGYTGNSGSNSGRLVTPGQVSSLGVPSNLKILVSSSATVCPGKSGRPVAISAKIQPMLHMSMGVLYFLEPMRTSGARYHRVTTSWLYDRTGMPKARASPKSASFSSPVELMSKFCGLRSRCSTRCSWQKPTPLISWYKKDCTCSFDSTPPVPSMYCFKSISRCSNTSVNFFSVCITSYSATILGWLSSLSRLISLIAVQGTPSSSESSRMRLSATRRPVAISFALYTIP
mmetsp:Transcript_4572/g.14810  ORF Transcript_4572/g.14810 Transcript_4572/m.14810 type:complete len:294 (+) Transcript_4572:800-1681(+)